LTTDYTDFTDSEFSLRAGIGKQAQQKETKTTKNPDSESGLRFLRLLLFKTNPCYLPIRNRDGKILAEMKDSFRLQRGKRGAGAEF